MPITAAKPAVSHCSTGQTASAEYGRHSPPHPHPITLPPPPPPPLNTHHLPPRDSWINLFPRAGSQELLSGPTWVTRREDRMRRNQVCPPVVHHHHFDSANIVCLARWLADCLTLCLSVCLSVCLSGCLSGCLSDSMSVFRSVSLSGQSVWQCTFLSVSSYLFSWFFFVSVSLFIFFRSVCFPFRLLRSLSHLESASLFITLQG